MSFFFMRFMLRMKKTTVITLIQTMLRSSVASVLRFRKVSILPRTKPLVRFATCVRGRTASAAV